MLSSEDNCQKDSGCSIASCWSGFNSTLTVVSLFFKNKTTNRSSIQQSAFEKVQRCCKCINQSSIVLNALCVRCGALPSEPRDGIFLEFPKPHILNYGNQCGILRVPIHSGPRMNFGFINLKSGPQIDFSFIIVYRISKMWHVKGYSHDFSQGIKQM